MGFLALSEIIPPGTIFPYGGTTPPSGWLLCDGGEYLRTQYPALFAAIGTAYGTNDATYFNVPDFRGTFLRGVAPNLSVDIFSVNTTDNSFRVPLGTINRRGMRVRLTTTGTLPGGLATNTDYFTAIGILFEINPPGQKVWLATTYANALSGTVIDLTSTGSGTHTLVQWVDPDAAGRLASNTGAATGNSVGSCQFDQMQGHIHNSGVYYDSVGGGGVSFGQQQFDNPSAIWTGGPVSDGTNGTPRTGQETRPQNVSVNYIIKF